MSFLLLFSLILLLTVYKTINELNHIDSKMEKHLAVFESDTYEKLPARLVDIGVYSAYNFPNYIPPEIINHPDENTAMELAKKHGENMYIEENKMQFESAQDGVFICMEYFYDGVKRKAFKITPYPKAGCFKDVLNKVAKEDKHFVYFNRRTNKAFIKKITKTDIADYFNEIKNKTLKTAGIITATSLVLGLILTVA
ncbi:hypothetical protein L1267_10985 [Pseudoalteromonas sp. OFAV1]|uniref:hypothetical protein n=1 Tax=Pseudoalteromonas sp. OFAV1 TaxID=2908892 RepID=UPI001F47A035|nr:hypothetical protein [Pseudoalteromonas sp. OFAV1]MCF2900928.1 hypothetical protein [Pseudoalteromonas sp. OFAV1]